MVWDFVDQSDKQLVDNLNILDYYVNFIVGKLLPYCYKLYTMTVTQTVAAPHCPSLHYTAHSQQIGTKCPKQSETTETCWII